MTEQYPPCNINYDCSTAPAGDPRWYPWNNQNDTGISGVTPGINSGGVMPLGGDGGFRLFGENISADTQVEVLPTSSASGTATGLVTTGGGVYPTFTTAFTPATSLVPAYITVTPDVPVPGGRTFWVRGRNPGGVWAPVPIIILTGAG